MKEYTAVRQVYAWVGFLVLVALAFYGLYSVFAPRVWLRVEKTSPYEAIYNEQS